MFFYAALCTIKQYSVFQFGILRLFSVVLQVEISMKFFNANINNLPKSISVSKVSLLISRIIYLICKAKHLQYITDKRILNSICFGLWLFILAFEYFLYINPRKKSFLLSSVFERRKYWIHENCRNSYMSRFSARIFLKH